MSNVATLVEDFERIRTDTSSLAEYKFPPVRPEKSKAVEVQWSKVIPIRDLSSWQDDAVIGVLRISNLPQNWDSYNSPPPTQKAVDVSINLLRDNYLSSIDLPAPFIVPISGGGIQIEWIIDDRELELEVLPDGSIEYLKSENKEPFEEEKIASPSSAEIFSLLSWLLSKQHPENYPT